jgi:FKBP-type peptidyl-prolyl cis-trans isomerase
MSRTLSRSWLAALATLAACAGGETKPAPDTTTAAAAPAPEPVAAGPVALEQVTFAPALNIDLATSTKLPSGMYIKDVKVGNGATAKPGMTVGAMYWGYFTDGNLFETNEKAAPIEFPLGTEGIIPGWNQGLEGMKVGGKRQLIIPSALAYGPAGRGAIGPNTNLVFVVELVAAK